MKWERSDLVVGSVVVTAVLVLLGGFLWLSPLISTQAYPIYTEFDRIDGIAKQAPVVMRGYTVGSVAAIEPRMDPEAGLRFRVRLNIQARLASGDSLVLAEGTVARLVPPPVIGAGLILLEAPPGGGPPLAPGSTIRGVRSEPVLEQVQGLADTLSAEILSAMLVARSLMDSVAAAMGHANLALGHATAALPTLLAGLERQLAAAEALTHDLHAQVGSLAPAALASVDSAHQLLADSRRLIHDIHAAVLSTTPEIHEILAGLDTTTLLLNHFVRQVTERPWRIVTGVRPPPGLYPQPGTPVVEPVEDSDGDGETGVPPGS
jgi:ABC-type transporter Mla subunit MlaD